MRGIERTQFTFYDSFFRAVSRIRSKSARCDAYDVLCRYALMGEEPELDALPNTVAIVFEMVKPNLEAGRKKAEGASRSANSRQTANNLEGYREDMPRIPEDMPRIPEDMPRIPEDTPRIPVGYGKDTASKNKDKDKNKNKIKNKDNSLRAAAFERFWEAYPRKEGRQKAALAFETVTVPLEVLLKAIEAQKRSDQWMKEGGRYIPQPANWLSGRRWEDQPLPSTAIPKGASGQLGEAELEAIERLMAKKRAREGS